MINAQETTLAALLFEIFLLYCRLSPGKSSSTVMIPNVHYLMEYYCASKSTSGYRTAYIYTFSHTYRGLCMYSPIRTKSRQSGENTIVFPKRKGGGDVIKVL